MSPLDAAVEAVRNHRQVCAQCEQAWTTAGGSVSYCEQGASLVTVLLAELDADRRRSL